MTEKFLSTLLLMLISSCYFIYNARRDIAAEKEVDVVIQMIFEHVLVQRFKRKEMDKKQTKKTKKTKTCKCHKASKFL